MRLTLTAVDPDLVEIDGFVHSCTRAAQLLATQIWKDTDPFVPALTGTFAANSRVYGNVIVYEGNQVNYLYEGHRMVDAETGKGPRYIPEIGYRWRKGAHLMPTSDPLHYTKDMHPKATDHWMEASERENGQTWERMANDLVANGWN